MGGLPMDVHGDRVPIPDPTARSVDALEREADSIRREMDRDKGGHEKEFVAVRREMKLLLDPIELRLDRLEEESRESGPTLNRIMSRFPLVIAYTTAVGVAALVLFLLALD